MKTQIHLAMRTAPWPGQVAAFVVFAIHLQTHVAQFQPDYRLLSDPFSGHCPAG